MCGIVGIFEYRSGAAVEHGLVRRMNDSITHRGPDDAGYLFHGAVGLGMRRLSVIDLAHYVHHRLSLAGSQGRPYFTQWALRAIQFASKGIPRVINNLCDKALLAAYLRDSDEVTWWDVRRAVRDVRRLVH